MKLAATATEVVDAAVGVAVEATAAAAAAAEGTTTAVDAVVVADTTTGAAMVVVGASALELRDFFTVPRFGIVPGPMVQLAGFETLKAGRNLIPLGQVPALIVALLLGALWAVSGRISLKGTSRVRIRCWSRSRRHPRPPGPASC